MTTRLPVTIVVFRNAKEFKPYAPNAAASAFFVGDEARDFIVMSGVGEEHYPTAVHEYMHLLMRHMDLNAPVWLNEGIAEVYSTLRPYAGNIMIGAVPQGRGWVLGQQKWIPLDQLMSVRSDSPEYNEKDRAGVFYAQSWMLTHMLMLGEGYKPGFGKFLEMISTGATGADAFWKVYAKSSAQVQRDLEAYYRSNSLKAVLFPTRLQKIDGGEPGPADPFATELALTRVTGLIGHSVEATARFERLGAQQPNRWEVWEALGNLAMRSNDTPAARKHFQRAFLLDPPVWSVHWTYARLMGNNREERESVVRALRRAVELNPALIEAQLMLGFELYAAGKYTESMSAYKAIRKVKPDRAAQLFLGMAHTAVRLENWAEAQANVDQAKKYARDDRERASAADLAAWLEQRRAVKATAASTVSALRATPVPQVQTSGSPEGVAKASEEVLPSVHGILKQVDCMVTRARLRIQRDHTEVRLLISDPDSITIRNQPGSSVTLTCGPQPAGTRVLIEYVEAVNKETGTTGDVKTIEFAAGAK